MRETRANPLDVTCPRCGALPGKLCVAVAGPVIGQPFSDHSFHGSRFDVAPAPRAPETESPRSTE